MTFRLSCYCSVSYLAMSVAWTSAGWEGTTDPLATVIRSGRIMGHVGPVEAGKYRRAAPDA